MRFEPVAAHTALGDQLYFQLGGSLHAADNDFTHLFLLAEQDVEHQFVMHLQDNLRLQPFAAQLAVHGNHRQLHDIGRAAPGSEH